MRNISKENFFELLRFKKSFIKEEIGGYSSFKISSYEAFILSTIVGAQYLDNLVFPFTPKGLMKVFHSHLNDRLVSGLWSGLEPHFSPLRLVKDRAFLNSGEKYLVPIEFATESEFRNQIENLYEKQDYPGQILVHRIEVAKEGNGQESLIEYLSCEFFRTRGFLVDSQIPLSQQYGSPDWMAISPNNFSDEPALFKGKYIFELAMSNINWDSEKAFEPIRNEFSNDFIVGEAKVAGGNHAKQISKYMSSGIFNRAILSVTDRQEKYLDEFDQLFFDESWALQFIECTSDFKEFKHSKSEEFGKFLVNISKFYLLSNYANSQISELLDLDISDEINSQSDLLRQIKLKPLAHFLNY